MVPVHTLALRPLSSHELPAWRRVQSTAYIAERMGTGESAEQAHAAAAASDRQFFPGGVPLAGHLVLIVVVTEANGTEITAGTVWLGPRDAATPHQWWVWSIDIDESRRGQGIGRRTMELAEEVARDHGAATLGLNVFGQNHVARALYDSLGYQPTAITMRKTL